MVPTLKNLSLIAVSAKLWDKHRFEQVPLPRDYRHTAMALCRQAGTLELPVSLLPALRTVILDFGNKKTAWARMVMIHLKRPLECSHKIHWNGYGMIDTIKIDGDSWKEFVDYPFIDLSRVLNNERFLYFQIHCIPHWGIFMDFIEEAVYYENPTAVDRFLPGDDNKLHFVRFLQALLAGNSVEVYKHWLAVHLLDTLGNALQYVFGKTQAIERERFHDFRRTNDDVWFTQHNYNDTIAWFVFEVLSEEQREEFLKLGQSKLVNYVVFRNMFANIFCHWPWHDKALEYFTRKQKLSRADRLVLKEVSAALWGQDFTHWDGWWNYWEAGTGPVSLHAKIQKIKAKFQQPRNILCNKKPRFDFLNI